MKKRFLTRMPEKNVRRGLCVLLCMLFVPLFFSLPAGAESSGSMVRVQLASLNSPLSLQLTLIGGYTLNGTELPDGTQAKVTMNASTGRFSVLTQSKTLDGSTSFTLKAKNAGSGVRIAQARVPSNVYNGDISFRAVSENGSCRMVVTVKTDLEEYVRGVLPCEMGESYAPEALKAQAVVIRTYALRKMRDNANITYDVMDTTADQVYNGMPTGKVKCFSAAEATRGQALAYGGTWAAAFYTSSNGGQTESVKNAWGSSGYSYLTVKDDPWDLASGGKTLSFFVSERADALTPALSEILKNKLRSQYGSGAALTGVYDVRTEQPAFPEPSRLYTRLCFYVNFRQDGKTRSGVLDLSIFSDLESRMNMSINSGSNELWSVEAVSGGFRVTARRCGHGIGMSQNGAQQMALSGMSCRDILNFYFPECELTGVSAAPVSPSGETAVPELTAKVNTASTGLNLRASASSSGKLLGTIPKGKTVTVREYGAEWCQVTYSGKTGCVKTQYLLFDGAVPSQNVQTQTGTAASEGRVTTSSGSLNLRGSKNGKVLGQIPRNAVIPLLEYSDGWYRTVYNNVTGYVSAGFVTTLGGTAVPVPEPETEQLPATAASDTARVNTASGSLNLRALPSQKATVRRTLPRGAAVNVLSREGEWTQVSYSGSVGFVMTGYLAFDTAPEQTAAAPVPTAKASGSAVVITVSGSLNLREQPDQNSRVLRTIPDMTRIDLLEKGPLWCRVLVNGNEGWVMSSYLAFECGAKDPAALQPSLSTARDKTMVTLTNPVKAVVVCKNGSLNLRDGCSTNDPILKEIPRYSSVTVLAVGKTWCRVQFAGREGFCMRSYLSFSE